jgi:hypothetical protein
MGLFKVIKTDENGNRSQCGGAVKTPAKAAALKARMRAQQKPGSSNSFSIDRA